jgi:uncharacterized protein (UPF0276 family)
MTLSGFGTGFRPKYFTDLMNVKGNKAPQWLEILSENFMGSGGIPLKQLISLREKFPICMHGVSMSIGGQDPFEKKYLSDLKTLIDLINPVYVSDHLCWTSRDGHNSHDLLPVPYTKESLNHICSRINQIQDHLDRTLFLENPSAYVAFGSDDMPEAEFIAEFCRRTGCGLLLDVNNLYVNQMNLGIDPLLWLDTIKPETIGYIHMAGHSIADGIRIDTHDKHVCKEVWDLYAYTQNKFGKIPSMIEWDGDVPAFEVILDEISKLDSEGKRIITRDFFTRESGAASIGGFPVMSNNDWRKIQDEFFAIVTSEVSSPGAVYDLSLFRDTTPALPATGAEVYANAYLQRLIEVFADTFPILNKVIGRKEFSNLVQSYLRDHKPGHYSVKFAPAKFKDFPELTKTATRLGLDPQLLTDLTSLEWAVYDLTDVPGDTGSLDRTILSTIQPDDWAGVRFRFNPTVTALHVKYRVDQTLDEFREGNEPDPPSAEPSTLIVYRSEDGVVWRQVNAIELVLLKGIQENMRFEDCCGMFQKKSGESIEDTIFKAVGIIGDWLDEGLIDRVEKK